MPALRKMANATNAIPKEAVSAAVTGFGFTTLFPVMSVGGIRKLHAERTTLEVCSCLKRTYPKQKKAQKKIFPMRFGARPNFITMLLVAERRLNQIRGDFCLSRRKITKENEKYADIIYMSIAPVSNSAENAYANKASTEAAPQKSDNGNNGNSNGASKAINIMDKVEWSDFSKERSGKNLPQSSLRQAEMSIALLREMKSSLLRNFKPDDSELVKTTENANPAETASPEEIEKFFGSYSSFLSNSIGYQSDKNATYMENLASAYDKVRGDLNENSESSNKHGKFLDNAFRNLADFQIKNEARKISISIEGVSQNSLGESVKKQVDIFADSFLKNYKKTGDKDGALAAAMEELNNMPETNSLSNISYKDFQLLSKISENSYSPQKSGENSRLYSELSDYLKGMFSLAQFGDHISTHSPTNRLIDVKA